MKLNSATKTERSLPPSIDGQAHGCLTVQVLRVLWTIRDPPGVTVARIKWWGETADGVCLWPAKDGRFLQSKESSSAARTSFQYSIRCGPQQLAAYLRDAGHLDVEVLANKVPQGTTTVPHLFQLSDGKPINGYFPIIKKNGAKIGQLHVCITIEDLKGSKSSKPAAAKDKGDLDVSIPANPPVRHKRMPVSFTRFNNDLSKDRKNLKPQKRTANKFTSKAEKFREEGSVPSTPFLASDYGAVSEKRFLQLDNDYDFLAEKKDVEVDLEKTAIETILGTSLCPDEVRTANMVSGFSHSASEDESFCSDLDPSRDANILHSLFYQHSSSDDDQNVMSAVQESSQSEPKVSFDIPEKPATKLSSFPKLKPERVVILKKVRYLRVQVVNLILAVSLDTLQEAEKLIAGKGSCCAKKGSWHLEYQMSPGSQLFASRTAAEAVSITAKKVKDNVVSFGHRSVFPVKFNAAELKKWRHSSVRFKVFTKSDKQRSLFGCTELSLESVMESPDLSVTAHLLLTPPIKNQSPNVAKTQETGHRLKVKVELASDVQMFRKPSSPLKTAATLTAKTRLQVSEVSQTEKSQDTPVIERLTASPGSKSVHQDPKFSPSRVKVKSFAAVDDAPITLHGFLSVDKGVGFIAPLFYQHRRYARMRKRETGKIHRRITRNMYLECRIFDGEDVARSSVCWASLNPSFNYKLVTPFFLSQGFLERTWNNFCIIEVWDKLPSMRDQLVGICKLPLHQFYISYHQKAVAKSVLEFELPVTAVDGFVQVTDIVTRREVGQLHVTLALGSPKQIQNLRYQMHLPERQHENQENVMPSEDVIAAPPDESTLTDESEEPQSMPGETTWVSDITSHAVDSTCDTEDNRVQSPFDTVLHSFALNVHGIQGLRLPNDLIWGEADCYITFDFPSGLNNGELGIEHCQTEASICTPNVVFQERRNFCFKTTQTQQQHLPTMLQKVCPTGIFFNVWCRRYSPSPTQNVIATATFPLSRLCALITKRNQGDNPVVTSSLPLLAAPLCDSRVESAGLLSVTMSYSSKTSKDVRSSPPPIVPYSVSNRTLRDSTNSQSESLSAAEFQGRTEPSHPGTDTPSQISFVPAIPRGTTRPAESEDSSHVGTSDKSFQCALHIERAMRLSGACSKERSNVIPNGFVSCELTTGVIATPVVESSDSPVWNFRRNIVLAANYITDPNKALMFKVWHQEADDSAEAPRCQLLGLVSVDLATIALGMDHVTGWYHITSYDKQCRGQLKVSVTPLVTPDTGYLGQKPFRLSNSEIPVQQQVNMASDDGLSRSLLINHLRCSLEELEKFKTRMVAASVETRATRHQRSASEIGSFHQSLSSLFNEPVSQHSISGEHEINDRSVLSCGQESQLNAGLARHSQSLPDLQNFTDLSNSDEPSLASGWNTFPNIARCSTREGLRKCSLLNAESHHNVTWDSHTCCKHAFADLCGDLRTIDDSSSQLRSPEKNETQSNVVQNNSKEFPREHLDAVFVSSEQFSEHAAYKPAVTSVSFVNQTTEVIQENCGNFPRSYSLLENNISQNGVSGTADCGWEEIVPKVLNSMLDRCIGHPTDAVKGNNTFDMLLPLTGEQVKPQQDENVLCQEMHTANRHTRQKKVRFLASDSETETFRTHNPRPSEGDAMKASFESEASQLRTDRPKPARLAASIWPT